MIICPKCNAQNEDGAGFCDQCGGPLGGAAAGAPYGAPPAYGSAPSAPAPAAGGGARCPVCGAVVIPGEAFCDNCGAALSSVAPVAPPPAPAYAPPPAYTPPAYTPPPPVPQPAYVPPAPVQAVARVLAANGQVFSLAGKTVFLIGREDAVSGIYPDVDTSASGGMEAGVGRRHAEISVQGVQWFIKDLNSVNGTWVNNQRLAPNAQQALNSGDQLRMGKWSGTFQL